MKRLLIDCSSVDGGGGLTQLKGMLGSIAGTQEDVLITVLVRRTKLAILQEYNVKIMSCPNNAVLRFLYQAVFGLVYRKFDYVYTVFGIGLGCLPKRVVKGINVALPIICYDDSLFWKELPQFTRFKKRLKKMVRRYLIKRRSDIIFCESDIMKQRLMSQASFPGERLFVVPPIESLIVKELKRFATTSESHERFTILYVTGNSFHKNLRYIMEHCASSEVDLLNMGVEVRITVTKLCDSNIIRFIGPVHNERLIEEYRAASVVMNVSDLESVSNNFMEAQAINKPMLINDVDFALDCVRVEHAVCNIRSKESFLKAVKDLKSRDYRLPMSQKSLTLDSEDRLARILRYYESY